LLEYKRYQSMEQVPEQRPARICQAVWDCN
jgi:hypothetical protein